MAQLCHRIGIQRQRRGRLTGEKCPLGGRRQQQGGVLPGDLTGDARAELAPRGAQRRLPTQAANRGGDALAPAEQLAAHPAGRVLVFDRQAGRVQVDPPQTVGLPSIGVMPNTRQEIFLRLPDRETRGRQPRGGRAARRGLLLAETYADAGLRRLDVRGQHAALLVQQHQRTRVQFGLSPSRHAGSEVRHPQEGNLPLCHVPHSPVDE